MAEVPKKILIVKLGAIGDVVHALPVLKTLRVHFPDSHISWVIEKKHSSLIENHPDLDDCIVIDTKKWRKNLNGKTFSELREFIRRLRNEEFDIAIDLQGLIKSGVISWLSGAKKIIGFKAGQCREFLNILFTNVKAGPRENEKHIIDILLSLLRPLGISHFHRDFFFIYPGMIKNI